ncbi:MAG: hypothetical protein JXB13_17820 [Phycisphaerae bacterium]|nr:hypothetical protein [Phycisphaerae bacterium]
MGVVDMPICWWDCAANEAKDSPSRHAHLWHSGTQCIAELMPGDQMWMSTSGKALKHEVEQAAFLAGIWVVREVIDNPDDDPAYPAEQVVVQSPCVCATRVWAGRGGGVADDRGVLARVVPARSVSRARGTG